MKTIIAGSRSIDSYYQVSTAIKESNFEVTTIISGTASGVDSIGEDYALENDIQVERYPANWKEHGKKAGYLRNVEMAENAKALIVIWDGLSNGSKHMIDIATKKGLDIHIRRVLRPDEIF